ncbi:hypothetical protein EWM64_g10948, partial [Hericium alpestre]
LKAIVVPTSFNAARLRRDTWSYIGVRSKPLKARPWTYEELIVLGFEELDWDEYCPHALCDPEGHIVAFLLGRPRGADWDAVIKEVTVTLERAEQESRR